MSDDNLLLKPRKPSLWKRITADHVVSRAAFLLGFGATVFTGLQYCAATRQADIAEQARLDAKQASEEQAKDVERSRAAAEKSAEAAAILAKGMDRSAAAAETSAQAGRDTLFLNRRTLILSNIPALQIFQSQLAKPLTANETVRINTQIFNGGRGVAYKVLSEQWIRIEKPMTFPYDKLPDPPSLTDIVPGTYGMVEASVPTTIVLNADDIRSIQSKVKILFVFGRVTYYDNTFEKPRKYTWYWCNYYNPDETSSLRLTVCPTHNYTDVQ